LRQVAAVVYALQPWVLKGRIPLWSKAAAMGCAVAAWGYIVIKWEYPAFLNYMQFYTFFR